MTKSVKSVVNDVFPGNEGYDILCSSHNTTVKVYEQNGNTRVLKIHHKTPFEEVRRQSSAATVLRMNGAPIEFPPHTFLSGDEAVTLWERYDNHDGDDSEKFADLSYCVNELHGYGVDNEIRTPYSSPLVKGHYASLSPYSPSSSVEDRIHRISQFINSIEKRDEIIDKWKTLRTRISLTRGNTIIHGDAHIGNLMKRKDGSPTLIDIESMSIGNPLWDWACIYADIDKFTDLDPFDYISSELKNNEEFIKLVELKSFLMATFVGSLGLDNKECRKEFYHRLENERKWNRIRP